MLIACLIFIQLFIDAYEKKFNETLGVSDLTFVTEEYDRSFALIIILCLLTFFFQF